MIPADPRLSLSVMMANRNPSMEPAGRVGQVGRKAHTWAFAVVQ
jgi:hypothetical protein